MHELILAGAASPAFNITFGLIVIFGGIGVIVNAIIVFIALQVHNERQENRRYIASRERADSI